MRPGSREDLQKFQSTQQFDYYRAKQLRLGHTLSEAEFQQFRLPESKFTLPCAGTLFQLDDNFETRELGPFRPESECNVPASPVWWIACQHRSVNQRELIDALKSQQIPGLLFTVFDTDMADIVREQVQLRYLEINRSTLQVSHLKSLSVLKGMWYLDLSSNQLGSMNPDHHWSDLFANLPQLHSLNLSHFVDSVVPEGESRPVLRALAQCNELYSLDLSWLNLTSPEIEHLYGLNELTKLALKSGIFDDSAFQTLSSYRKLQFLSLKYCQSIQGRETSTFNQLSELRGLELNHCIHLSDHFVSVLAQLPTLEALDLSCCQSLTEEGLKRLGSCSNLRQLSLLRVEATNAAVVKALAQLSKLEYLDLEGCTRLSGHCLEPLLGCHSLQYLKVANCPDLSYDSLLSLTELKQLRGLDVSGCGLPDRLIDQLRNNTTGTQVIDNRKAKHKRRHGHRRS